jgi:glycosyltransferase involved in cell wall biosynthesis
VRLSVLTPTFNYGRFLDDAIASVVQQGVVDVEHVVVDGASSDETLDVLQRAPASVVWKSEPDNGQSDALNKALALATGDWIGWLNADEFYLPGAFDALAAILDEHPDADLIYGDAVFTDVDGGVLRLVAQHSFSSRVLRWNRCNISSCAMIVRRDAIPERGWDVELRAMMDWDLYLELLARRRRIVYVPHPIGAFRVHAEQVTADLVPRDHPDIPRLALRHHRPSGWARPVADRIGELEHRVLKMAEGGVRRELRVRDLRGTNVRWFDGPASRSGALAVVAAGSGLDGLGRSNQHQARGSA